MKELLCFLFLSALTLTASELTGKWTGSFEITNSQGEKANTAFMDLRLNGNALTGTAGPNASEQVAIRNGKLEAGKLTFNVDEDDGSISLDLVFDGDTIRGTERLHFVKLEVCR